MQSQQKNPKYSRNKYCLSSEDASKVSSDAEQILTETIIHLQAKGILKDGTISSSDIRSAIKDPNLGNGIDRVLHSLEEETKKLNELFEIGISCQHCVTYEKVSSFAEFKEGDHIRFLRYRIPGTNRRAYDHHAIITVVGKTDIPHSKHGKVTVVHFSKHSKLKKYMVFEEDMDIDIETTRIDLVIKKSNLFSREKIAQRAKDLVKKYADKKRTDTYNILFNNCEDIATEITTGNATSFQRDNVLSKAKCIYEIIESCIIENFQDVQKDLHQPVMSVLFSLKLLYIAFKYYHIQQKIQHDLLCLSCGKKEKRRILFEIICISCSLGLTVFRLTIALPINSVVFSFITISLMFLAEKIYGLVQAWIYPAGNIPKQLVKSGSMIKKGDVITFPYCGLYHEGIVAKTDILYEKLNHMAEVTIIYLNRKGLEKSRISKETIVFNLQNTNVSICDIKKGDIINADDVVERATEELGSNNWGLNYTCRTFAMECKTGRTDVKNEEFSIRGITRRDQISLGDVIFIKNWLYSYYAVVVNVKCPEEVKCDVIHFQWPGWFEKRVIARETFHFKLKERTLYVHNYFGEPVYDAEEVIRRAESRINDTGFNTFTNRSSHVAKWCKVKSETKSS